MIKFEGNKTWKIQEHNSFCNIHRRAMTPIPQLLLWLCFHAVFVRSEVGHDFTNCNQFFYKGSPPQLQRQFAQPPKSICQLYQNQYHFATLYSTSLRMPLYSAYKLPAPCQGSQPKRKSDWFIEPQVSYSHLLAIPLHL